MNTLLIPPDHYIRNSGGQPGWVRGGGEEEECPGCDDDQHGGDVVQEDVPLPPAKQSISISISVR